MDITHIHTNMLTYTHTHHIDTHNTHTCTVCYKNHVWEQTKLGQSFQVQTHRTSEEGRPSSDHNIVSPVLKVQISMTCRVVPAHHNQFVFSCRSQWLSLINYNNRSVLPCDCICVHMCMCVPVCARVCVHVCVCLCSCDRERDLSAPFLTCTSPQWTGSSTGCRRG